MDRAAISLWCRCCGHTPEQALSRVKKYKAAGAQQIKIYSSVKPEIVMKLSMTGWIKSTTSRK
jgi:hypothetical protein